MCNARSRNQCCRGNVTTRVLLSCTSMSTIYLVLHNIAFVVNLYRR